MPTTGMASRSIWTLCASYRAERGALYASFRAYMGVQMDAADAFWRESLRPRLRHQFFRMYGGEKGASANLFNDVEKEMTNTS